VIAAVRGEGAHQGKAAAASPIAVTAAAMLSALSLTAPSTSAPASPAITRSKPTLLLTWLRSADREGAEVTGGTGAPTSLRIWVLLRMKSLKVRRLPCSGWFRDAAMRRSAGTAAAAALGVARAASAGCSGGRPSRAVCGGPGGVCVCVCVIVTCR